MLNKVYADVEERMKKALEVVQRELMGIRTGKATPALLEGVKVEYYGNMTPLNQVANISVPDHKLLVIQPWDKTLIGEIVKAIQKSNLGLTPISDANIIRLPIPPLTEERRKDLVKLVKKLVEDGKVAVRNIRRDANENIKKNEKEKKISEDDSRKGQEKVQEMTDKYIKNLDEIANKKEKEVMEV
jgi:ribosome recycling factor